jgi:hypothetical protein
VAAPATSNYANPLRDVAGLIAERVDQGVDYSGAGPVYAIGNGIVENVFGPGWPGGTFIQYRLTDGPLAGQHVYLAEDVRPQVSVGDRVTSSTVLGEMFHGPSGIETGWADPNVGAQRALGFAQWKEGGPSTADGANFNELLVKLGAPSGIIHGPISGTYAGAEAGTLAAGTATDATLTAAKSSCPEGDIFSLKAPGSGVPLVRGLAPKFTFTKCQGRAVLGAAMLVTGMGLILLGVAVMAAGTRAGKQIIAAAPLVK